jgi:hypothetical protein
MGAKSTRPRSRRSIVKKLRKTTIKTRGLRCNNRKEEDFEGGLFVSSKKPQKSIAAVLNGKIIAITIDRSVAIEKQPLPSGKGAYLAEDGVLLLQKVGAEKQKQAMLLVSAEKFRSMSGQRNFWSENSVCKTAVFNYWGG